MSKALRKLVLLLSITINSCSSDKDECSDIACVNIPDAILIELVNDEDKNLLDNDLLEISVFKIIDQEDQSSTEFEIIDYNGEKSIIKPAFKIAKGTFNYSFVINDQVISEISITLATSSGCCSNLYYENITIEDFVGEYNGKEDIYKITFEPSS